MLSIYHSVNKPFYRYALLTLHTTIHPQHTHPSPHLSPTPPYQAFKAKPIDKRIFDSMGELGVPKVAAKPVTETVPFELRIDKRATIRPPPATNTDGMVDYSLTKPTRLNSPL